MDPDIQEHVIKATDCNLVVVPQIEPTVMCMAACLGLKRRFAVHLHEIRSRRIQSKVLFFLMRTYFLSRVSYVLAPLRGS